MLASHPLHDFEAVHSGKIHVENDQLGRFVIDRLERRGLVRAWRSEPLPERGGRARRYFTVTPTGLAALRSSRQALLKLWSGLERRLES